ncbi:MAG: helix-turn-helix transcriptional regulator [Kiritimatiellae bacterium]|nr:helix-turn-helix transcriptional regulator [Kiritimatiellia bacterium]
MKEEAEPRRHTHRGAETRLINAFWTYFPEKVESRRVDMHYAVELGIVCEGAMERRHGSLGLLCRPGEVWLHSLWEMHNYRIVEAPCRVTGVVVRPEVLADFAAAAGEAVDWFLPFTVPPRERPQVAEARRGQVLAVASHLEEAIAARGPCTGAWLHVLFFETLLLLYADWRPPARPGRFLFGEYRRLGPSLELVLRTRLFVSEQAAAGACGMTRNTFNSTFRRVLGISFAKFALRHRLKGAAQELSDGGIPPKETARAWGFTDLSHFHRRFRQYYGCTPGEYRARTRESGR